MNKIILLIIGIFPFLIIHAQNVGINQPNPTNSLHINPINSGDHPLRIEGLQSYNVGDTSLLIINNISGVVKYITLNNITSYISNDLLDNQGFNDSIISIIYNNADTLLYNNSFINNLRDSIDTDVDSVVLNGTILHIYENGNDIFTNLNNLQDGTGTDSQTLSLSNNSLSISGGNSVDLSQFMTPAGAVFAFPTSTPPSGYLACNGQAVSRTTYANLFSLIGTSYGSGNGSTTFNLPNYNGQFLRGWDNGQGTDLDAAARTDRGDGTTGDVVGSKQANQTLAHNHTVNPPATVSNATGNHLHTIDPPAISSSTNGNHLHTIDPPATNTTTTGAHTHSIDPPNSATTTNGNHDHSVNNQVGNFQSFIAFARNDINPGTASDGTGYSSGSSTLSNDRIMNINPSGNHNHTVNIAAFNSAANGNHTHSVNIPQFNSNTTGNHTHTTDITLFNSSTAGNHTHSTDITQFNSGNNGGSETRPTNVSVLWCIKF